VLAATSVDVLTAVLSIQATVIVGLLIYAMRTREKVTRLEEWARLYEKRLNGER
jgi:hypothetical protein